MTAESIVFTQHLPEFFIRDDSFYYILSRSLVYHFTLYNLSFHLLQHPSPLKIIYLLLQACTIFYIIENGFTKLLILLLIYSFFLFCSYGIFIHAMNKLFVVEVLKNYTMKRKSARTKIFLLLRLISHGRAMTANNCSL